MFKHFYKKILYIALIVTLGISVAIGIIVNSQIKQASNPLTTGNWFTPQELGKTYHLFDLGVADINQDKFLDVYTLNHSVRQRILINNGDGELTDKLIPLGLSHKTQLPGAEPTDDNPNIKAPGIYVFWHKSQLIIRVIQAENLANVDGSVALVTLPKSVIIETKGTLEVETKNDEELSNQQLIAIKGQGKGNGQIIVSSLDFFFAPSLHFHENIPLEEIFVGAQEVHPLVHQFALPTRDRHGMAWADYNGDGQTDVFIIRGGGGGRMKPDFVYDNDKLMIQENTKFEDTTRESGIRKGVCPGRRLAWVDVDGDGLLDIYVVCGRGKPPRSTYPNQLHQQKPKGKFTNVAGNKGLDIPANGLFVWLDADDDQDLDLLWIEKLLGINKQKIWLYTNKPGQFTPQLIGKTLGKVSQLTVSDYDRDGNLDVFAASPQANTLIANIAGKFQVIDPKKLGLPEKSYTANWVDYDNDGLTDLHVLPGGIYRQQSQQKFSATNLLASNKWAKFKNAVFCTWFDEDNNGSRDLLIAMQTPPSLEERIKKRLFPANKKIFRLTNWKMMVYRNVGAKNNWLEVELVGSPGNRPGIGAQVAVETPEGIQWQQVGQAEGSLRSQGHYRLYFGLKDQQPNSLKILWPDGFQQEIPSPPSNQLLVIQRSKASS